VTETNALETAQKELLDPAGLDEGHLSRTLGAIMRRSIDAADLYFQSSRFEGWSLEDGIVREGSYSQEQGVGVRAIYGDKTGFAYSDELVLPALEQAADAARAIAAGGGDARVQAWSRSQPPALYPAADPVSSLGDEEKTELLRRVDRATRALDSRVKDIALKNGVEADRVDAWWRLHGDKFDLTDDDQPLVRARARDDIAVAPPPFVREPLHEVVRVLHLEQAAHRGAVLDLPPLGLLLGRRPDALEIGVLGVDLAQLVLERIELRVGHDRVAVVVGVLSLLELLDEGLNFTFAHGVGTTPS